MIRELVRAATEGAEDGEWRSKRAVVEEALLTGLSVYVRREPSQQFFSVPAALIGGAVREGDWEELVRFIDEA